MKHRGISTCLKLRRRTGVGSLRVSQYNAGSRSLIGAVELMQQGKRELKSNSRAARFIDEPSAVIDEEGSVGEPKGRLDGIPIPIEAKFLINASKWAYQCTIRRKHFSFYKADTSGAGFTEQFSH